VILGFTVLDIMPHPFPTQSFFLVSSSSNPGFSRNGLSRGLWRELWRSDLWFGCFPSSTLPAPPCFWFPPADPGKMSWLIAPFADCVWISFNANFFVSVTFHMLFELFSNLFLLTPLNYPCPASSAFPLLSFFPIRQGVSCAMEQSALTLTCFQVSKLPPPPPHC